MSAPQHLADQWHAFSSAMDGARMHHGWILAGKQGLGKAEFAMLAARAYVGTDSPAQQHPDIHLLTHLPKDAKEEKKRDEGKTVDEKEPDALLICDKQRNGEWEGSIGLWFHKGAMQYVGSPGDDPLVMYRHPEDL